MKRRTPLYAALATMLFVAPAQAKTELLFNLFIPRVHHFYKDHLVPWAAAVEKESGGRLTIKFTASSLGPIPRQFDLARTGVADIAIAQHVFNARRFVLPTIADLPFAGLSSEAASVALWKTHEKYFAKANEHKGVRLLAYIVIGPSHLWTIDKPVRTLADSKGMKIRAAARYAKNVVDGLGGVLIAKPGPVAYELISKGAVDATAFNIADIYNFRISKFLKNVTVFPGGLYAASFSMVMNQAKWDGLSKEDRAALMRASGEHMARLSGNWDEADRKAWGRIKKSGVNIIFASDNLIGELKAKFAPLEQQWVEMANKRGVDGAAALAFYKKTIAEEAAKSWRPMP